MESHSKEPLTAGQWAKQTKWERIVASWLLLAPALGGLAAAVVSMRFFSLGEMTGSPLTDTIVLVFVVGGSLFALNGALFLRSGPVCRHCLEPLKDTQFRCPKCAQAVDPAA